MTEGLGFTLRPMGREDLPAGLRLCRASGWNQREEDWRELLSLNPGGFLAAVADGRVVGTAGAMRYDPGLAWVCMILVDPESRRQGVGRRITQEVLKRLEGVAVVGLDATPGGRAVYSKLGLRESRELARFDGRATPASPTPAARAIGAADLPAVRAWDREAFGADRESLLRWLFAQAPEYAWCAPGPGRVEGYCFGRHGHNADHIGPVVARQAGIARDLVRACLAARPGRRFFIDVPREPAEWPRGLAELGFAEQRPFTRMYRGDVKEPGRPAEVFAVTGPEFG